MNATIEYEQLPADAISLCKAARLAGVTPTTMTRWVRKGYLPAWERGDRCFVSEADVRAQTRRVPVGDKQEPPRTSSEDAAAAEAAMARIKARGW